MGDPTDDSEFDVPDLDLDLPPAQSQSKPGAAGASTGAAPAHPGSVAKPSFGLDHDPFNDDFITGSTSGTFDLGGLGSGQPSAAEGAIDLGDFGGSDYFDEDFSPASHLDANQGAGADGSIDLAGASGQLGLDVALAGAERGRDGPTPGQPWPTGTSPERAELAIDPLEIQIASGYGEPPASVVLAPAYAIQVLLRERQLKREVAQRDARLQEIEAERDQLLIELVTVRRPELEGNGRFGPVLDAVRDLEQLAREREQGLSSISAELNAGLAALDKSIAEVQTRKAPLLEQQQQARQELDVAAADQQRLQAKAKRIEIEKRNLTEQVRRLLGPEGGEIPAPQARQLARLADAASQLAPQLEQCATTVNARKQHLDQVDTEIAVLDREIGRFESQKRALKKKFQGQIAARQQGVTEAQARQEQAVADAGRALLALRGEITVDEATLDGLRRVDAEVQARSMDAEKYLRALDAYDASLVSKGRQILGGAIALLVLLIVLGLAF